MILISCASVPLSFKPLNSNTKRSRFIAGLSSLTVLKIGCIQYSVSSLYFKSKRYLFRDVTKQNFCSS